MLSLTTHPSCSLTPAADAAVRQERCLPISPEALLASLVAHIRNKSLSNAQCMMAIRATLSQLGDS